MAQDLPIELWFSILSYLPRGSVRKLLGINRPLFELALNDIYHEIRLTGDNKEIWKTFERLRYPTIANRVRHLYIEPAFFPLPEPKPRSPSSGLQLVRYLKGQVNSLLYPGAIGASLLVPDPCQKFLVRATEALSDCIELKELTIVLRDHPIPPSFALFLSIFWKTHALRLRRLDLDLTPGIIPFVVDIFMPSLSSPNVEGKLQFKHNVSIEEFNFTLALPTYMVSVDASYQPSHLRIAQLLNHFKFTLRSLSITSLSESCSTDFTAFFLKLTQINARPQDGPRFPFLQHFSLHFPLHTSQTLLDPTHLNVFLHSHRLTLKSISLSPHTGITSRRGMTSVLPAFRNHVPFNTFHYAAWVINRFLEIKFPMLERLELRYDPGPVPPISTYDHSVVLLNKLFLSRLGASGLRELELTGLTLELPSKLAVLKDLASGGARSSDSGDGGVGGTLKRLKLGVNYLQPEILDLVVKRFIALESLELIYMEVRGAKRKLGPGLVEPDSNSAATIEDMKERTYLTSNITLLKCAIFRGSCTQYHPQESIARVVREAFAKMPELDLYDENICCSS